MIILQLRAVVTERTQFIGQRRVVGRYRPTVTESAKVFARIEAMRGGVAKRAYTSSLVAPALRLCGILQNLQPVLLAYDDNRIHISRLAVEMYGDDGPGARSDCGGNTPGIEIER